jgi:hypothetical protein
LDCQINSSRARQKRPVPLVHKIDGYWRECGEEQIEWKDIEIVRGMQESNREKTG